MSIRVIQSGASGEQLGWVDLDLGSYPGWWAASVATYCQAGWLNILNLTQPNQVAHLMPQTVYSMFLPYISQSYVQGPEIRFQFGSYLSQILMDFDQIWLILKLTVPRGPPLRFRGSPNRRRGRGPPRTYWNRISHKWGCTGAVS